MHDLSNLQALQQSYIYNHAVEAVSVFVVGLQERIASLDLANSTLFYLISRSHVVLQRAVSSENYRNDSMDPG